MSWGGHGPQNSQKVKNQLQWQLYHQRLPIFRCAENGQKEHTLKHIPKWTVGWNPFSSERLIPGAIFFKSVSPSQKIK